MERKFNTIIKEIIIGFGFLNGLWFAIGTSPETEILGFLNKHLDLMPPLAQKILFAIPIILTILTIITIIKIYHNGRVLGIIAVILAFISGALILRNWQATLILLLASIVLGLVSFKHRPIMHSRRYHK
jgi:hypothetical protein